MVNGEITRINTWLDTNIYTNKTRQVYISALRHWAKCICDVDLIRKPHTYDNDQLLEKAIDDYINDTNRNYVNDLKMFVRYLRDSLASRSVNQYYFTATKFFSRQEESRKDDRFSIHVIDREDIKQTLLPPPADELTDKKPSKEQLRRIIEHLSVQIKAVILFLVSSGCRIGEALEILIKDVNLDADPPNAFIKPPKSKGGYGGRKTRFSYEARDAIIEWRSIMPHRKKKVSRVKKIKGEVVEETEEEYKSRSSFNPDKLFDFGYSTVSTAWYSALRNVNLDQKDSTERVTRFVYRLHTLRKFIRTDMANAGVPRDVVDTYLGHAIPLKTYVDLSEEALDDWYTKYMHVVTIYGDRNVSSSTKIIDPSELDEYVIEGWDYRDTMPDGRIIITRGLKK